jgi:pre-mRNA-splicing factor ISY1
MARSREKANLLFNRWTSLRDGEAAGPGRDARRPYLASEVKSLPEAEKWRRQLLREIGASVADIQNAGLGEARLRDLNDAINKLLREKVHWERQIRALGGPNYAAQGAAAAAAGGGGDGVEAGREVAGGGGYRYFGAARDLPGVRELFATEGAGGKRGRSRGEIFRSITPDYYGYRDEEDGELLRAEAAAEAAAAAAAAAADDDDDDSAAAAPGGFSAHVPLPAAADIAAAVLARKRQKLMEKYVLAAPAADTAPAR